jgi:hypothetical protein
VPEYYEIKVKGRLDPRWSDWLGGMQFTHLGTNETILSGVLPDQASFYGVLERIRDLNLTLISISRREPGPEHEE